jgi:hypothetical protein
VKSLFQLALAPLVAVALFIAPPAQAIAQAPKPVALVSVASIKENLADVSHITRLTGMTDQADTAMFFVRAMLSGIDKERPLGVYFVSKPDGFHGIAFIPFEQNGLATFLKVQKETLGEPKDVGNGILEVGNGKTAFLKEQGGWVFAAESKEFLSGLPDNPVAMLGNLPKEYNVAAKLLVQNVPDELRRMTIDEIKVGIERFLDSPAARQGNVDREQARQLTKVSLANLEKFANEADELFFGLGIDEAAKHAVLDIGYSGKEGTSLARTISAQADLKTNFAGFMLPDASVTLNLASKVSQEDMEQIGPALQQLRGQLSKQIDDSPDIPADKRDAIKGVLAQIFGAIEKTAKSGRIDGGGALVLQPKSVSFAFGGAVADGAEIEKILKSLVDLGQGIPKFPKIQLNSGSIGEMKLHRLTAPIPVEEGDTRELLGENLEILIGISQKTFIVAGGKNADAVLRKVLDGSAQTREKAVSPLKLDLSLLPILKFAQSMDDNPIVSNILRVLEPAGKDHVTLLNQVGTRSDTYRLEIQEGVIKAIGEGAKSAGARLNRGGQ